MDEIPLYEDVRSRFLLNSSKAFTYLATAALIWIIFFLIYIPTSVGVIIVGYFNTAQIISLIALLGILMLLYRAFHYYIATCNALGMMITLARAHDKTYDEFENYSEIVIYSLYILSVIIAYIFLWQLISVAIGTLSGVVLTIVIFWILWMIVKIVMRFDRIEKLKVELGT
jgi:hypothetical protein